MQTASVEIISSRVEQASASAASIQSANKTSTEAGTSRQSIFSNAPMVRLREVGSALDNEAFNRKASVANTITASVASETKGRRRKKLLNPPAAYARTKAPAQMTNPATSGSP